MTNQNEEPMLRFEFKESKQSEIDQQKELEDLFKKRNEILASMGKPPIPYPSKKEETNIEDKFSKM